METWIIILVIVIGIVVRVLSAKAKKKAQQQQEERNAGEEGRTPAPPPRASSMSDIQRAFMQMSGLQEEPEKAPPVKAPPVKTYSGSAGKSVPMSSSEGRAGMTEGLGSYEGAYSTEGKAGKTEGVEFHAQGSHSIGNKFADVDLTALKTNLEDDLEPSYASMSVIKRKKNPLRLFENKDDFTKAVIYSEILNRRTR